MTEQEGVMLVERFNESNQSQRAFCRKNEIKRSTLRYWIERCDEIAQGKEVHFCGQVLSGDREW